MGKLIIDGNSVYEIDEECICKKEAEKEKEQKEVQKEKSGRREY